MSIIFFDFLEIYIYKIEMFDYNENILKGGETLNNYIIEKLKEGRTKAKLKQSEVAKMIGIKGNTLSNYENGVSEPDIDTFCALCDIYNIDPSNILNEAYGLGVQGENFKVKPSEIEMLKKYRALDPHGKEMVDFTLLKEWERSKEVHKVESAPLYSYQPAQGAMVAENSASYGISAAHERTDIEVTDEMRKHDDNIMDDENF